MEPSDSAGGMKTGQPVRKTVWWFLKMLIKHGSAICYSPSTLRHLPNRRESMVTQLVETPHPWHDHPSDLYSDATCSREQVSPAPTHRCPVPFLCNPDHHLLLSSSSQGSDFLAAREATLQKLCHFLGLTSRDHYWPRGDDTLAANSSSLELGNMRGWALSAHGNADNHRTRQALRTEPGAHQMDGSG